MFAVRERNVPSKDNTIFEFTPSRRDEEGNKIDSKYEVKKNPFDNKNDDDDSSDDSDEEIESITSVKNDSTNTNRIELENIRKNLISDFESIIKSSDKNKLNEIRTFIDSLN